MHSAVDCSNLYSCVVSMNGGRALQRVRAAQRWLRIFGTPFKYLGRIDIARC